MKKPAALFCLVLALALALLSLYQLTLDRKQAALSVELHELKANQDKLGFVEQHPELKLINNALADPQLAWTLSEALQKDVQRETVPEKRIALLCQALRYTSLALAKRPEDARLLVAWGNMRQVLGSYDCQLTGTSGVYLAVIEKALLDAPNDFRVKLAAATVLNFAGQRDRAFELLYQVLLLDTTPDAESDNYIFRLALDTLAFEKIIPARFPQIARFSRWAAKLPDGALAVLKQEILSKFLIKAQLAALNAARAESAAPNQPVSLYKDELLELADISAGELVRTKIDQELSSIFLKEGQDDLAKYYLARSQLKELPRVAAALSGDTRPQKQPLLGWEPLGSMFVDEFYNSLGFFLGGNSHLQLIELTVKPLSENDSPALQSLRIFASRDNEHWEQIEARQGRIVKPLGGQILIYFEVPNAAFSYWKIAFLSANRSRTLTTEPRSLLKVYGH